MLPLLFCPVVSNVEPFPHMVALNFCTSLNSCDPVYAVMPVRFPFCLSSYFAPNGKSTWILGWAVQFVVGEKVIGIVYKFRMPRAILERTVILLMTMASTFIVYPEVA